MRNQIEPNEINRVKLFAWIKILRKKNNKLKIYDINNFNVHLKTFWNKLFQYSYAYNYGIKALVYGWDEFNKGAPLKAKLLYTYRCFKIEVIHIFSNEFSKN